MTPEMLENAELNPVKTSERPLASQLRAAVLTTPFKKLAIALSGGGFRAAAYSLGTMSYLHRLKYTDGETGEQTILDNVEFVSSASGGTFAGMLYTMHVRKGLKFEHTYHKLLEFLNGQVLLENVLEMINDETKWKGDKSRNLINAFATIYDQELFKEETFQVYWPEDGETANRPIEVCFNATEFYRGISFRFQAANRTGFKGKIGNNYTFFSPRESDKIETAKKMKLGDIMAASSCFPAGFEPILFPKDFAYNKSKKGTSLTQQELKNAFTVTDYDNERVEDIKNIGLMDGGINDNQAVYSAVLADKRRRNKNAEDGFDLIFVTDVASYFMKSYEAPDSQVNEDRKQQNITQLLNNPVKSLFPWKLSLVNLWLILSFMVALITGTIVFFAKIPTIHDVALVVCSVSTFSGIILLLLNKLLLSKPLKNFLPSIFSLSGSQLVGRIKKDIPASRNFSDEVIVKLTNFVAKASLATIEQMLKSRLNSMLSLVLEINLKQTRRLIFDTLYGNFYGKDTWQNRRLFNVIYELSSMNIVSRNNILNDKFYKDYGFGQSVKENTWAKTSIGLLTANCANLNNVAEKARTMGTTLWTDNADIENKRIKDVIACGQFTTCVKLLEYCFIIERVMEHQDNNPNFKKQIQFDDTQKKIFQSIKANLIDDWQKFKKEPYFVFDKYQ